MKKVNKNNSLTNTASAVTVISVVASFHHMGSKSSLATIIDSTEIEKDLKKNKHRSKQNGQCARNGSTHSIPEPV